MTEIPSEKYEIITNRLREIEAEHNVDILLAIESGSRAWGFASPDSDFDVRFIYRNQLKWYLSVLPRRDVIEYPIVDLLDYSGWDLRKSFYLMNKSNPVLFEWLQSPIQYKSDNKFVTTMKELTPLYFSMTASVYHYLNMARNNYRDYLRKNQVKIKKYFYVLRPILACLWIEEHGSPPPLDFETLLEAVLNKTQYADLKRLILELLEQKRISKEMGRASRIPEINAFIEQKIEHFELKANSYNPNKKPDASIMNAAFHKLLQLSD